MSQGDAGVLTLSVGVNKTGETSSILLPKVTAFQFFETPISVTCCGINLM